MPADIVGGFLILECGGKRSATPLWATRSGGGLGDRMKSAVAATALPGLTNNFGMHGSKSVPPDISGGSQAEANFTDSVFSLSSMP